MMDTQISLVIVLMFGWLDLVACLSPTTKDTPTTFTLTPTKSNQPSPPSPSPVVLYTAETARQSHTLPPSTGGREKESKVPPAENLGFVNPSEFASSLPTFDFGKSVDSFPDFFNSNGGNGGSGYDGDIEREPPYGGPFTSSSNYNSRRDEDGSKDKSRNDGFVDPNIQFRSLFDAAGTEGGFSPGEFLNYNNENGGPDGSKSAQSQSFPSYTYTGRENVDSRGDHLNFPPPSSQVRPRYRSSYRQLNPTRNRNGGNYNGGNGGGQNEDVYPNPNRGGGSEPNEDGESQEKNDTPERGNEKGKGESGNGKSKCKKVIKEVEDEGEYNGGDGVYPGGDEYDPSTYQSRYKRQVGRNGRQNGNGRPSGGTKRPMTCYVCEDEDGRYAEKCSYDSNSDPNKKGNYFHSSSTSFTDNGKPRGRRDRYKRDPTFDSASFSFGTTGTDTSLPKRIQKRQSEGNRYASDFQGKDDGNTQQGDPPRDGGQRGQRGQRGQGGIQPGHFEYIPSISVDVGGNGGGNQNPNRNLEIEFGPPHNFGQNQDNSQGYGFDFFIPKDLQQDISQSDTTNQDNPGIFSGGGGFGADFDIGYDDYVKKHFPEAFGSSRPPSENQPPPQGGSGGSPGRETPSYDYRGSGGRGYGGTRNPPQGINSQEQPQYSPPLYYGGEEVGPEHLEQAITQFNQKDRKDCGKIQRGDMTCFICKDHRGINKEECMYASNPNDPRSGQMAYHEVSEYSSLPQNQNQNQNENQDGHPVSGSRSRSSGEETKKVEQKVTPLNPTPPEYDFDY